MERKKQDYLEVVYTKSAKPLTAYPDNLARFFMGRYGLRPGMSLLDVGCGRGEMLGAFSRLGLDCSGLDMAPSAGSLAPGVPVRLCNVTAETFPVPDASCDAVIMKSVIEHMVDPTPLLAEVKRVLKPGGLILVLTPDWASVWRVFFEDATHVHPYMAKGIAEALAMHGFEQAQSEQFCHHELLWETGPVRILADLLYAVLSVPMARRLAKATGVKFLRWAVERQLLATGRRPA
ncbi:Methyltransferase domain-containing protein [Humidesulfovibrio mexicanus]|uniref:Methyltransferase domain-containing protein n=1 Tax=Humidesulfovibrio mexicanus TaxID=147047 RepID=A0A239ACY1_9BACT|nr:class I SAM-dependent methyltransferase [Humidesulfovibrio mexicanus]SNR92914.1 Methyltransferase domain-containing protein [Humidesulfovibrio mexicanus]